MLGLGHDLPPGKHTHSGLPTGWEPGGARQGYREASGTTFAVDRTCAVGNSGTCLDSPHRRYAAGQRRHAGVPLSQVVTLLVVVVDVQAHRAVRRETLSDAVGDETMTSNAVRVDIGCDSPRRGTGRCPLGWCDAAAGTADCLARRCPALVGVDSVENSDLADRRRPLRARLLGDDVSGSEHRSGLGAVPARSGRLHAAGLTRRGVGTRPVRASARVAT